MKTVPSHRTFIGPAEHYELLSGRHFMLFFVLGMRERHRFLDFGCGSLRSGRLIMTYLAPRCYFGIDPNKWLIDAAIEQEVGRSLIQIKKPQFAFHSDGKMTSFDTQFDFIHAHSVLTHADPTLARTFFAEAGRVLTPNGLVVATFLRGDSDYTGTDWAYPDVISYRLETMTQWASEAGLQLQVIRWPHRAQTYFVAARASFDLLALFEEVERTYGIGLLPDLS
jgi:SAM-dependent methyltransferase